MRIQGRITLIETPGRKEPWVKKQTEKDYFLALEITKIDDKEITNTKDAYLVLRNVFPEITINQQSLNDLFENITLPPNAKNVSHITLGNFPDFREDRNVANDLDKHKILNAEDINGQLLEFEVTQDDFELVVTTEHYNQLEFNHSNQKVVKTDTVGFNRDAVINIKPSFAAQEILTKYAKEVFGSDFQLWNSQRQPIPFHITVAQTNSLSKTLNDIYQATAPQVQNLTTSIGLKI